MAVSIRLRREGALNRPYYKVVVADSRSPRDGRFIEKLGSYNPMLPAEHDDRVRLRPERIAQLEPARLLCREAALDQQVEWKSPPTGRSFASRL